MSSSIIRPCALLVDDDEVVRRAFKFLMQSLGWDYVEAAHAQEALDRLAERKYDLAIIDINMPETNGIELCRMIHLEEGVSAPLVLMLSGSVDSKSREAARLAGATAVLEKPIGRQDMIDEFRKYGLPCQP